MANLNPTQFFHFDFPLDLASTIAGGLVGLLLVYLVEWLWRPSVKYLGLEAVKGNPGTFYKLRFRLAGRKDPDLCCLQVEWCGNKVFAKWDETPNPLKSDQLNEFAPERVPETYYQPLFLRQEYSVPILIKVNNQNNKEVFSGWWFGKGKGYGPDPTIEDSAKISLTLLGSNFC